MNDVIPTHVIMLCGYDVEAAASSLAVKGGEK